MRTFNLFPSHALDLCRRDQMTAFRAGRVERCENLVHIDLSAWHPAILSMAKEKQKPFLIRLRAVRPVKLDFYDHPFDCPICGEHIVYTSMHTVFTDSRRKCPSCQGELLIHEGTATAIRDRKPPKASSPAIPKRSSR